MLLKNVTITSNEEQIARQKHLNLSQLKITAEQRTQEEKRKQEELQRIQKEKRKQELQRIQEEKRLKEEQEKKENPFIDTNLTMANLTSQMRHVRMLRSPFFERISKIENTLNNPVIDNMILAQFDNLEKEFDKQWKEMNAFKQDEFSVSNEDDMNRFKKYYGIGQTLNEWIQKQHILNAMENIIITVDCNIEEMNKFLLVHFNFSQDQIDGKCISLLQETNEKNDITLNVSKVLNELKEWKEKTNKLALNMNATEQLAKQFSEILETISTFMKNPTSTGISFPQNLDKILMKFSEQIAKETETIQGFCLQESLPNNVEKILIQRLNEMIAFKNSVELFLHNKVEKFQQHFNILADNINLIDQAPKLLEEAKKLARDKTKSSRDVAKLKLDISHLTEDLIHADESEKDDINMEIEECNSKLIQLNKQGKEFHVKSSQLNIMRAKLIQIGFKLPSSDTNSGKSSNNTQSILKTIINDPSLSLLEMSPDYFKTIENIPGVVSNHVLYLAEDHEGKKHIVKRYLVHDEHSLSKLRKELKILNRMKHPNLIRVEGVYSTMEMGNSMNVYICMPYFSSGNLKEWSQKQTN